MKKFLSLLLALTLVLSLVVVPARADVTTDLSWTEPTMTAPTDPTAARGTTLTFTVSEPSVTKNSSPATKGTDYEISYAWSGLPDGVTSSTQNPNQATGTVTGIAGNYTVKCTVTVTAKGDATGRPLTKELSKTITISDAVLDSDVTTVSFNGRSYAKNAVYYASSENQDLTTAAKWTIDGYNVTNATKGSGNTYTLTVTKGAASNLINGTITVTAIQAQATGDIAIDPAANHRAGQPLTFSLPDTVNNQSSTHASFSWLIKKGSAELKTGTSKTLAWTPAEDGTYTVTCAVKEGGKEVGTLTLASLAIAKENYRAEVTSPAAGKQLNGSSVPYSFSFKNYTDSANPTNIDLSTTDITWTVTSGSATFAKTTDKGNNGTASNTLTLGSTAGNVTVKATFTYLGKNYTVDFPTITNVVPTYTLGSTYCGYNNSVYNAATLKTYANNALTTAGITGVTTDSVALASASSNVVTATGTKDTGYTLAASPTYLGTANLTATVTKSGGGTFKMTFKVPVLPIPYSTSLGTVNAEPYTTGSTYYNNTYRVTLPTTFNQYYVVSKNTTPNYNVSAAPASGVTTVTLNQNDFVNGQCTLYVIAWNSNYNGYGYGYNYGTNYYGKYYSGAITVTQTNYNIQYNGVAGETVQFAQSDFTDFMNEVAEARGDASKTKSYPYVTFDYVTFSLPTTAQGTLYYGGTAMSTSNSSGAFNRNTKVTNLDSVTFVPNDKTTAKTITLNFTLYATRYSSSSTSRGTTVSYSGSVVVNLVREDIKYTVSQGDSVRFDESDFLSYLRSTKGYSSNYTIDYVTFDQSAVSAVNEGSLYTYYNGYNYGGSVKTTDKFYYNATASQNALSDVAFLASRYAKTGETVYIPFTIYARYGSTGTGTRQLTGTVAIKIGQTMNFIDVKTTDYFYNSVKWAVGKNITNGTSSTTFSPYKSCTRAEIVTFLWRAAGSPEPTITRNPFRDVNAVTHSSYYKAILWASQKGITSGTSATAFSPDQVCTRAQIVTFLYRYAGQPSGYYSNPFKDVGATSEASYYKAILWAVGKGITTGTSATTFSPYASCNRAEAVTFLYRYTNGL